jgi:hypothetical protein
MDVVVQYAPEILWFLLGNGSGALIAIRISKRTSGGLQGNIVNQKGASAGGDIIGRDSNKNTSINI